MPHEHRMLGLPDKAILGPFFSGAMRVCAFDRGAFDGEPPQGTLVFELEGEDIARLYDSIFLAGDAGHNRCDCRGDAVLVFERDEEHLGRIVMHHGETIRFQDEMGIYQSLEVASELAKFLAEHGLTAPLRAWEQFEALLSTNEEPRRSWIEQAPPPLRSQLGALESGQLSPSAAVKLLNAEYANASSVVGALFSWNYFGEWASAPAYERIGLELLDHLPLAAIEEVIALTESASPLVGAARYFATTGATRVAELGAETRARLRAASYGAGLPPTNLRLIDEALGLPEVIGTPGVDVLTATMPSTVRSLVCDGDGVWAAVDEDVYRVTTSGMEKLCSLRGQLKGPITYLAASSGLIVVVDTVGAAWGLDPATCRTTLLIDAGARHLVAEGREVFLVLDRRAMAGNRPRYDILASVPGSSTPRLVSTVTGRPWELRLDEAYLYTLTFDEGWIVTRIARTGGAPETIAALDSWYGRPGRCPRPPLTVCSQALYFASDERTIAAVSKQTLQLEVYGRVPKPIVGLAAGNGVLFALGEEVLSARTTLFRIVEGECSEVVEYARLSQDQDLLVAGERFVAWATDHRVVLAQPAFEEAIRKPPIRW